MNKLFSLCMELFFRFLKIGAFSFGGGYASLSLLQEEVVQRTGWLSTADFAGLCAIAEITPGPVSLNAASFTGWQIAGPAGAISATLGCILPSVCIIAVFGSVLNRYREHPLFRSVLHSFRPVICAMMAAAAVSILL